MARGRRYSETEIQYITDWAGKKPWSMIASHLGKSPQSVMAWASRHGVRGSAKHPRTPGKGPRRCEDPICGREYESSRDAQRFCSPTCSNGSRRYTKYGLTSDQWLDLLRSQDYRCAICRATESNGAGQWHTDHDHSCCPGEGSCGKCVRGLLCSRCNAGLGMFKDSEEYLFEALKYLRSHDNGR